MNLDFQPCVYILTNWKHSVLYTGVTSDLQRRVLEHRNGKGGKFTRRYNATKLVLLETAGQIEDAISREKQIKSWSRKRKIELINQYNPDWNDLYEEYFG